MNFKYYRVTNEDNKYEDQSSLSFQLKAVTGFDVNDYIKPVIQGGGDLLTIIADESEFKGHYCSGMVILPFLKHEFQLELETQLEELIKEYKIENIHFTSIFGKKRVLKNNTNSFLYKYSNIVSNVPMMCLSFSKGRNDLLTFINPESMNNEEIFFSLFWNNMLRVISVFPDHSIFHIHFEQEYSVVPSTYEAVARRSFEKLYSGIDQIYSQRPDKHMSICKHPQFFSKNALLYSSLSDFLAYSSNKLQSKIDSGMSDTKIIREYRVILQLFKKIFANYSGLSSNKLIELIDKS